MEESSRQPWPSAPKISLDLSPRSGEQRAQDAALGKLDHRMDAAQALGPGAAQELGQNGFGLVVAGVGGGHGLHLARSHELPEPAVAQAAGGLLDGFGVFLGRCPGIDPRLVEGQAKFGCKRAGKGQVAVGLLAAQAVVQMGGVEHQAQLSAPLRQSAQQGHGVGAAREAHGQAKSRPEQRHIDGQLRRAFQNDKAAMLRLAGEDCTFCIPCMNAVSASRAASLYTPTDMQVFAILPAAGLGTRMAGPQPKQFLILDGLPILIHSLRAFASVARVTAIYVAVRKPEMERVQAQIAEYGFAGRVRVVEGGDSRQESVSHALAALPAQPDDVVLVHDAVRPLIDAATIERTIDAVLEHGAAIVGLPAVDTIKQVERTAHGALITSTIPREFMVLAQTPQGFRFGLLQSAFAEAMADGFVGTDEASVVERAGHPVAVVHGSRG